MHSATLLLTTKGKYLSIEELIDNLENVERSQEIRDWDYLST